MLEPHYIVTSNYEKSKCTIIRNPHIHMPTDIQDTTVEKITGNSLPIKWLGLSTFTAMDPDLMPGWRRSHKPHGVAKKHKKKRKERKKLQILLLSPESHCTYYNLHQQNWCVYPVCCFHGASYWTMAQLLWCGIKQQMPQYLYLPGEIAKEAAIWPASHFCLPMSCVFIWSAKSKSHLEIRAQ